MRRCLHHYLHVNLDMTAHVPCLLIRQCTQRAYTKHNTTLSSLPWFSSPWAQQDSGNAIIAPRTQPLQWRESQLERRWNQIGRKLHGSTSQAIHLHPSHLCASDADRNQRAQEKDATSKKIKCRKPFRVRG